MSKAGDRPIKVRLSFRELLKDQPKLNAFLRALKRVQELPPDNPNSFWVIGGYHGTPYVDRETELPEGAPEWGGWCQHRNVLFPTWHRAYLLRFEQALQAVSPEDDIALPYWDSTSEETLREGIPRILCEPLVEIDGEMVRNPLKSYILPRAIGDKESSPESFAQKPKGYETVRYPFSGISNPPEAKERADEHNAAVSALEDDPLDLLNLNLKYWLNLGFRPADQPWGTRDKYRECLKTPKYNAFSNASSASYSEMYTSLESPHDEMRIALGGYHPNPDAPNMGLLSGANGDMGQSDVASFDPIFFLHHCNVDRVFWIWQKIHDKTTSFQITADEHDPGTNADNQGPSPDQEPGQSLGMTTPLVPFLKGDGSWYTSYDVINIEKQLGYTYSSGSLETEAIPAEPEAKAAKTRRVLEVSNIDRSRFQGSFVVVAYHVTGGRRVPIGHEVVFSRWNMKRCRNCQRHLNITMIFSLADVPESEAKAENFAIEVMEHDPVTAFQIKVAMPPERQGGPKMEVKTVHL